MAQSRYINDSHWQPEEVRVIDNVAVRFRDVCVHQFQIGDVEDPALYAGEPLYQWQQSEAGQWIMKNAVQEPYWIQHTDVVSFGYRYKIMARLSEQNETFWRLKWGSLNK